MSSDTSAGEQGETTTPERFGEIYRQINQSEEWKRTEQRFRDSLEWEGQRFTQSLEGENRRAALREAVLLEHARVRSTAGVPDNSRVLETAERFAAWLREDADRG
jgi:hypothetical protein